MQPVQPNSVVVELDCTVLDDVSSVDSVVVVGELEVEEVVPE